MSLSVIGLHAGVLFSSYLAFFLAVVSGLAFLMQERRLKLKDPRFLISSALPLELLDRINLYAVVTGFLLFTFGMGQGYWMVHRAWGTFLLWDPKELASLLTWAAYAGVLVLRLRVGLRGRRVVFISVLSFGLVLFTLLGVQHWVLSRSQGVL